jgi:hypothetical protein
MQITEEEIPDFLNNTEAHRVEKKVCPKWRKDS